MSKKRITNASTRFATFGVLGFFGFTVLSGKFELNLHSNKRVMQALCVRRKSWEDVTGEDQTVLR